MPSKPSHEGAPLRFRDLRGSDLWKDLRAEVIACLPDGHLLELAWRGAGLPRERLLEATTHETRVNEVLERAWAEGRPFFQRFLEEARARYPASERPSLDQVMMWLKEDDSIPPAFSPVMLHGEAEEVAYRRAIAERFRHLDVSGLTRRSQTKPLSLEDVFVRLRAVVGTPGDQDLFSEAQARLLHDWHHVRIDGREMLLAIDAQGSEHLSRGFRRTIDMGVLLEETRGRPLIILGDPGSGKTTLLAYLAWAHADREVSLIEMWSGRSCTEGYLPVSLSLAGYAHALERDASLLRIPPHSGQHSGLKPDTIPA